MGSSKPLFALVGVGLILVLSLPFLLFAFVTTSAESHSAGTQISCLGFWHWLPCNAAFLAYRTNNTLTAVQRSRTACSTRHCSECAAHGRSGRGPIWLRLFLGSGERLLETAWCGVNSRWLCRRGNVENPSYEQVCSGRTGHSEVVRVVWSTTAIDFSDLLKLFWECHNPTQGDQQGNDRGSQYRSAIYTSTAHIKRS